MAKEKRASWFKVFHYERAPIEAVSDADAGLGLKMALRYFDGEELPADMPLGAYVVFCTLKPYIDESLGEFAQSVANGRKRSRGCEGVHDPAIPSGVLTEAEAEAETEENILPKTSSSPPDKPVAGKSGTRKKRVYGHDAMPYRAAAYLAGGISENFPEIKPPNEAIMQSWADQFRLLNERDGYDWPLVGDVLEYAVTDDFWRRNILSGGAFRRQFPKLLARSGCSAGEEDEYEREYEYEYVGDAAGDAGCVA